MQESVKLPVSPHKVPTVIPKAPPNKGLDDQQLGTKRRKITATDNFPVKLNREYPSFTKTLTRSHVSKYFVLGIPESFCKDHLPSSYTSILLENESGKIYKANYLSKRREIGCGWRDFSLTEKLSEGDVLIFRLVSPNKFKVQKIRKKSRSITAKEEHHVGIRSSDKNVKKVSPTITSQADEFESKLGTEFPSFKKTLVKSHVSGGFWMGLPSTFCRDYLPSVDTLFVLEYENGNEYKAKYLAQRTGFSGGWRGFSIAEKFAEGDVLLFQLVNPSTFKVHRIRKSCLSEENEAMLNLDASVKPSAVTISEQNKEKHRSSSLETMSGDDEDENVTREANEFRSNINPTFTKSLLKSHVSKGFWMMLPPTFCKMHLPSVDTWIKLENENDEEYKVKYLAERTALSGGLKAFSVASNLAEGDVLLFQLVNSTKFKVKKIRSGASNVNGERVILSAGASREQKEETHQACPSEAVSGDDTHVMISSEDEAVSGDDIHVMISSEDEKDESIQKVETTKKDTLYSGDVKHTIIDDHNDFTNFDSFLILLDDFLKEDNNLSDHIKRSYYQLCCSQKSLLHTSLLEDINRGMAAGCIMETVDIANAIKSCELTIFNTNFSAWDRKLKILELTGMNVKFLSAHLLCLQRAASSSGAATQKYKDMCSEHAQFENMIKSLQDELNDLRRLFGEHADDIKKLKTKIIKEQEMRFQEKQVSCPW